MAAISSEQRLAFFRKLNSADHSAATKSSRLPFSVSVSPLIISEDNEDLENRQKAYKSIFRQRNILELHVGNRQKQLHQLNPVIFRYLNEQQKMALTQELEETRDLINHILYMDAVEDRCDRLADLDKDAKTCQMYIDWIESGEKPEPTLIESYPTGSNWLSDLISKMNTINGLRLYWVWGKSLLDVLFTLCQQWDLIDLNTFNNIEDNLNRPTPFTGNLSWSLYYLRLLLRISICIRPILPGGSEERQGVSTFERLLKTIDDNKYALLNDIFWGTVNLACYAWLTYRKNAKLGAVGDRLTAGFLIMDWILTFLDYIENQKKYFQNCSSLENEIEHLKQLLLLEMNETEKNALWLRLINAEQRLSDYQFEFKYTNMELVNGLVYATLLMLSFPLLIGLIAPAGLPLSTAIVPTGAILCFTITVIFQAIENLTPVVKACSQRERLLEHQQKLIDLSNQTIDINQQKILVVQIDDLQNMIDYQQKQINFQKISFSQALTVDMLFPVLVFGALFSMPIGSGIAAVSAGLILAIGSKKFIDSYAPAEPEKVDLSDEQIGERIEQINQSSPMLSNGYKSNSFYQPGSKNMEANNQSIPENKKSFQATIFCPA